MGCAIHEHIAVVSHLSMRLCLTEPLLLRHNPIIWLRRPSSESKRQPAAPALAPIAGSPATSLQAAPPRPSTERVHPLDPSPEITPAPLLSSEDIAGGSAAEASPSRETTGSETPSLLTPSRHRRTASSGASTAAGE